MKGKALKGFTASDVNNKHQGLAHIWGLLLSFLDNNSPELLLPAYNADEICKFTRSFFSQVDKTRYTFFVEEENIPKEDQRNPLKGSYPYGRTGKTANDPLHAYLCFGLSRRGTLNARLITPGHLTPREGLPSYDGEKKLKRGPSGKYRHIASYSLEELLDLIWDGSLYVPTKGSHEVDGHHVPFIPGYDSDSEDEYEPIDIERGLREGTVGLSDA
ncbi:hypothetical protein FisN_20Hu009 [Fistulifera solaris]|uniref:Uncharacterized protein n=1 Tax=Fistulifera solaris TaxID=1519565 RepID=A0A1Z5KC13_FISSO|nr:hypothetical protein FisN_20Hu009 [Fistulifera solaris]|eukprot:GAX23809.1 hypothetical protein FisN_20Hu009 [Fistulifera solaris]